MLVTRLERGEKILIHMDGTRVDPLGDPALDEQAARLGDELMWAGAVGAAGRAVRRRHAFPAAAADRVRRRRLRRRPVQDGRGERLARVRGRPPRPLRAFARFPDAEEVAAAWPEEAFHRLGGIDRATAIAVLTHDPKLDDAALVLALRSDAGYIGAMGSRRAQASGASGCWRRGSRSRIWTACPPRSGSTLGALTAEETALSIIGEIVAMRHGRSGGRLAHAQGRIHEVGVIGGLILAAGEGRRFGATSASPSSADARCWSTRSIRCCRCPPCGR